MAKNLVESMRFFFLPMNCLFIMPMFNSWDDFIMLQWRNGELILFFNMFLATRADPGIVTKYYYNACKK